MAEVLDRVRIAVWGAAGMVCSFPQCGLDLMPTASTGVPSPIGDVAHIVASSADGPRGDSALPELERNLPANLLLLCKIHHKLVDDDLAQYTVDALRSMKSDHEGRVQRQRATIASVARATAEAHIGDWANRADVDIWEEWTRGLVSPLPSLTKARHLTLWELARWMRSRHWHDDFVATRLAFAQFERVLTDMLVTFDDHADERGDSLWTERFYKIREWDPDVLPPSCGRV